MTSCLFADAEQDKTPSEEKLALFKEAKLGRKKGFPGNKNEDFEQCKDVFYKKCSDMICSLYT